VALIVERSLGLDLLVIGSRGYGPLRAVLLGAVSGRVIRDAACPVIVVPRGAEVPLEALLTPQKATA
jgi:nucleotide-binding universal stress UspA family protein